MNREKLFEQFPPVSTKEWMDKIAADLKGADFRKLVWKTGEGFDLMPFYRAEDLASPAVKSLSANGSPLLLKTGKSNGQWLVRQEIVVEDYAEANRKALDILMKGVQSLGFVIPDPETVNTANFRILLKDIHPEAVELNFISEGKAKEIVMCLREVLSERNLSEGGITGAVEADPLGRLMSKGTLCVPVEEGLKYLAELTASTGEMPFFRTIHIQASKLGNSGAGPVQELGIAIAMAGEYMARLTGYGISAGMAASKIRFSFGISSNYFMEIARLRAARLLWATVLKGYGCEGKMEIHSTTSRWNKTAYDPYVNMLRTQTEAMSAVLGGTDSLTVEPFDTAFRKPGEFSARIARNQQLILREEAGFDRVADPSAGSYYIEKLTGMVADNAWKLFTEIEDEGGFLAALQKGTIQERVKASAERLRKDVATRKVVLLGTNQYPLAKEVLHETADSAIIFDRKDFGKPDVEPVVPFRGAEEFEKIRMAVHASGMNPAVFILTIGNPVMRKARAQFSSVFFGCAGYKIIDNAGFSSIEEGISAAIDSKAKVVVVCSSDEEYPVYAPEVFRNLKDSSLVVVAGNPSCSEELKSAGIEYFIHLKSDVPGMLKLFSSKLGIRI